MKHNTIPIYEWVGWIIVLLISLISIRYLFVPGFLPTHDGEYHLIRFYEFGRMLDAGNFFPRWAPGLNSGYGVPLFTFFYPLPNYIGSLFHLFGWSLADSFRWTMAAGYIIAIIASYYWLKRLYGTIPAVAGSVIGAFTPYWFVDIFVRGSIGEVLAIAFVFIALSCVVYEKKTLLAFAIAGIIVSHNIIAMIFLPIIIVYAWMTGRSLALAVVMGIILSSYFWVPALVERRYVVGLNTVNYQDHFPELAQLLIPSWGTGLSGPGFALDEMSYQIGFIPMLILLVSPVLFWRKERFALLFIGAAGVALFLMLEISIPVWEKVPLLPNLQYPWRLLSVGFVVTPFLAAAMFSRIRWPFIAISVALCAGLVSFSYTKPVLYAPRPDAYYLSRREFTDGTSSLGNGFSTAWMAWQPARPAKRMEIVSGEGSVTMKEEGMTKFVGEVDSSSGGKLRIHVAYYPGWNVVVDGKSLDVTPDEKGMISVPFSPGTHLITTNFFDTPLRVAVNLLSLVCLVGLAAWGIISLGKSKNNKQ
ncbi:MAG: hypothetical protein AAB557_00425 [Patescibacteria group bacterium]